MPHFDLPLDELRTYRTAVAEPAGLDAFWARAIGVAHARAADPVLEPHRPDIYGDLEVMDVTFTGGDGDPIKGWYLRPRHAGDRELACNVVFIGYGGGRGLPYDHALYAAAGHAVFVMDTRSQGASWQVGHTPDPGAGASGPEVPGVMTRGVIDPETYYYRRLYVDAVRAVETAAALPGVDAARIAVSGMSQGGGLALAAAALTPGLVRLCHAEVPFLCDIERAISIAGDAPYTELVEFLARHTELVDVVLTTVRYIDNALLATRIRARTVVSVGLMDTICPPSTVFAAYNAITAPKHIEVYPYVGHERPAHMQELLLADFVRELGDG
jgi:cephalosporin-C deacetylase